MGEYSSGTLMVTDFQHEGAIVHRPALDLCVFEFFWHTVIFSVENFSALNYSCFLVSINAKLYNMNNFHYHPSSLMEVV